ncbi:MAG: LON peptidase substrate-binding domain-containing protein [Pirellulaceae bacterium]|nr:LON peptidase substrate-binding domain-containing protein [Pirellulaceae bacterium]
MSDLHSAVDWPDDFSGRVRLFPLPNLVLFPHVVQPLHIFEPRYCEMLADSMANDRLIAMALLEPGWEMQYQKKPPIASVVCIGKVITHTPTADHRHNILLAGLRRGRIIREIECGERSYRQAEVDLLMDDYPADNGPMRAESQDALLDMFSQLVPDGLGVQESFQQLLGAQLPLGILTDVITFTLNLPLPVKQQLLAEANVDIRCRILSRCLKELLRVRQSHEPPSDFPPRFSSN